MRVTPEGKALIKEFESLELVVYLDPVGILTGGWGHTGEDVNALGLGAKVTKAQAEKWFAQDVREAEQIVRSAVKVDLPDEAYSALCSFVFNTGPGKKGVKDGFVTLKNGKPSSLLTLVNAQKWDAAAKQFDFWVSAKGKKLAGLVRRRGREKAMFLEGFKHEEQQVESNVEADCQKTAKPLHRQPGAQATAAVTTAALLNEQASKFESLSMVSDYALWIFIALTVLALLYTLKKRDDD